MRFGTSRRPSEKSAAEKRREYLDLACQRGKRDEPIHETIERAERIRAYVEDGVADGVNPVPCSPGSPEEARCSLS